ncbi:MAG: phytoene desaturase [Gluconacetobacter diazotrophicus]|nr:phytoene desaturase [Gluconacetobacter diazotrophicus]
MKPRVVVIGAGVGGLTCAALLAKAGLAVTVFEKNERVGGKLNWLEEGGYTWDTGPSLLTMPYVFERLWEKLDRRLEDDLELVPLPVTCRYRWTDGTVIDEDAAFWERPDVARFLRYSRGLYDLSAEAFLHHPLGEWWRQLRWRNLGKLRHLPKIASFRSMDSVVRRFFGHDPHLVQLFNRFATYNGSSPYATPAAFNIIPYVEAKFGGWYVRGGMYEIARALERICRELGVRILTGCEVRALGGMDNFYLQTAEERTGPFDKVVCNQDVLTAYPRLLPGHPQTTRFRKTHLERLTPSISGFVLYLGVAKTFPELSHHNIFFSDDYPREFRQLFTDRQAIDEPTIYVAVHSKHDPGRAPAGGENWFVLVNAPALAESRGVEWPAVAQEYGDRIIARLETRFGFAGLRDAIRVRRHFTPADFETRYLANAGSLYGFASHGVRAAFQRPGLQPKGLRNLYFVGGSTHPGGGLPLVCLSGQMVADKILRRQSKPEGSG